MSISDLRSLREQVFRVIDKRKRLQESGDSTRIEAASYELCRLDRRLFVAFADYVIDERPETEWLISLANELDPAFTNVLAALLETDDEHIEPYNADAPEFDLEKWTRILQQEDRGVSPTLQGFCESVHQKRWLMHQIALGKSISKLMNEAVTG